MSDFETEAAGTRLPWSMGRRSPPAPPPPSGVRPSVAAIYEQYLDYVLRTARRWGLQESDAEDVAHRVFLDVNAALDRLDTSRSLRPWLKALTRTQVRRTLKQQERERPAISSLPEVESEAKNPEEQMEIADARRVVLELLNELSLERREVFVMAVFDEMTMPEIAAELRIPLDTGYTRLKLARRDLDAAWSRRRSQRQAFGFGVVSLAMLDTDALLELEKPIPAAPGEVRERIFARLAGALGPALFGGASAAGAAAAGRVALTMPQLAGGAVLALALGFGVDEAVHALLPPRVAPPVVVAAADTTPPVPTGEAAPVAPSASNRAPVVSRAAVVDAGAGESTADSGSAERNLIRRAITALDHDDPAAALRALDEHARRFPHGRLAQEREALRAQALGAKHTDAGQP